MRMIIALFFLLSYNHAYSDSIQKWTDATGKVHYGDSTPPINAISEQKIKIYNSFDESSYKAGVKRNSVLYKDIKQIEKREAERRKNAKKRLDDYYIYLDKKRKDSESTNAKKRRLREKERNSTSIKMRRTKPSKSLAGKPKSSKLN